MHVLIIPSWYKLPNIPNYALFVQEQASLLSKKGVKIGVLYPNWSGSFLANFKKLKEDVPEDYMEEGIPTLYLNVNSVVPFNLNINLRYVCAKANKKYKDYVALYGKPDVIHAHSVFVGGVVAQHIGLIEDIPYFVTEHSTSMLDDKSYVSKEKEIIRGVYHNAARILAVSDYLNQKMKREYDLESDKIITLHNVINPIFFNPTKNEITSQIKIISLGALSYAKNFELAINAIHLLLKKGYDIKYEIAGEGPLLGQLTEIISKYNCTENIRLIGYLTERSKVLKKIQESHILISSSRVETFGITLAEALALGRPIVTTDSKGVRDIVTDMDGIIVKQPDPQLFADEIEKVILNYSDYDPYVLSEHCEKRFSEDVIILKLIEAYRQISKE